MSTGDVHPRLLADCHEMGNQDAGLVLLHRNAILPWFILVPLPSCSEFFELGADEMKLSLEACAGLAAFIRERMEFPKINFAAIGNVVPQLHLHVVGRKPGDACWPAPVWGNLQAEARYRDGDLDRIRSELTERSLLRRDGISARAKG